MTASLLAASAQAEEIWQTLPEPPALPAPAESGMAPVNDVGDVWGFRRPARARNHRVIVADSRGHGRSTRSEHHEAVMIP